MFGEQQSILKQLDNYPSGYALRELLKCDDLADIRKLLDSAGKLTLFCPTTEAFKCAEYGAMSFGADPAPFIKDILVCHAANQVISSSDAPVFFENLCTDPNWVNRGGKGQVMQLAKSPDGKRLCLNFGIPCWGMWTATVYQADIACSNGNLFFISNVIRFPYSMSSMCKLQGLGVSFRYLLESCALNAISNCTPSITVFVPQSMAIDKYLSTAHAPEELTEMVKVHHVKGMYYSPDLKDGMSLETFNDIKLKVSIEGGTVKVNGIKVIKTDIICKNGVIHFIEDCINPMNPPKSSDKLLH